MMSKAKFNLLEIIPVRRKQVITERVDDGTFVLIYPRFKYTWMNRLLPKGLSPYFHVSLEEHGSAVWEQIDGRHTVQEIIENLADHFHNETGYETRVTTFICQLQKDRFITYFLPGQL